MANVTADPAHTPLHEYVIGFFERKSVFAKNGVVKFKHLKDWDRMQSNFLLQQEIFKAEGWVDSLNSDREYVNGVIDRIIARAKINGVYEND